MAWWVPLSTPSLAAQRLAHKLVKEAIIGGRLARRPCEVCGIEPGMTEALPIQRAIQRVVAHHDDYSKPLEVRWLCLSHHAKHHWTLRKHKTARKIEDVTGGEVPKEVIRPDLWDAEPPVFDPPQRGRAA